MSLSESKENGESGEQKKNLDLLKNNVGCFR